MERIQITPRPNKNARLESRGLSFHAWDDYWKEDVCYKFTAEQIDLLEEVTTDLHQMCLTACQHVIDCNLLGKIGIPEQFHEAVIRSWVQKDMTLYGRFDLAYDGINAPKMLEYNADTPTSLLESAVSQWDWLEDKFPDGDQFNSLHEKLVARWAALPASIDTVYFASLNENEEDWVCVHYLMETVVQSGRQARHIFLEGLGYDSATNYFVDLDNQPIKALFKLYPWEWMMREDKSSETINTKTIMVEPMWKAMLSSKALLPILWELFPDHPNLLPAYFEDKKYMLGSYAKKPIYSREGANITLVRDGVEIAKDEGPYGAEGYVYQQLFDLPEMARRFPIIGSWIVGEEAAGMCLREDSLRITTNMSNFVPHYFE